MIKDGDCFSVHCSTNAMCEVTEGAGKLARVWREKSGNGKMKLFLGLILNYRT